MFIAKMKFMEPAGTRDIRSFFNTSNTSSKRTREGEQVIRSSTIGTGEEERLSQEGARRDEDEGVIQEKDEGRQLDPHTDLKMEPPGGDQCQERTSASPGQQEPARKGVQS